ncbi:hydroxyectoine utilization dehydratase EutB [Limibacillus sp. MBR-115]|jgi:threonine dehydratase|uniref:hydroxyectoine utilization dehydratase EutB n=1 Tax=Limibacillus sp. MBR-115 TaxID=3156465 RepID=UPI003397774C
MPNKPQESTWRSPIVLADILAARKRIGAKVLRTPLVQSSYLSQASGQPIWLKLEQQQRTGSFKLRGASNAVACLPEEAKARGVVGVSTGNHGRGLAHAASAAGVACSICMSSLVPANKVAAIREEGADVRIVGRSQDEAQAEVNRLVAEQGMTMLPPFDHPDIIAGQGTLGLEIMEQLPQAGTFVIQLSGGGLISGIAVALRAINSAARIIGVSMERGAAMYESQRMGKPTRVEELETLADSLGGGIGSDNRYTFGIVRELVDEIVLVNEAEIATGIAHAYWQERQIVEGAGAVTMAALLAGKINVTEPTVLLLSGANIDLDLHHRIITDHRPGSSAEGNQA